MPEPGTNAPAPAPAPAPKGGTNAPNTAETARKTHRLGDYELVAKLGQGAMGSVYLAHKTGNTQQVAIKVLPLNLAQDQEFLERFRREARAASKLTHPNIVAAIDVGFADNKYHFIAMEYIDGPNLEVLFKQKGKLKTDELIRIAKDIANALTEAETHGVVHRDIKPANILTTLKGAAKLTDLGLSSASAGDQRVTMAGYAVGTPYYISPEQARGQLEVDGRADIYSLGATLYHLVTGTLPFPGTNPVVIMTQHIQERPQPAHLREPSVPRHFSLLLEKMMAKDPAARQQNAQELLADLELCANGKPPAGKAVAAPAQSRVQPNKQRPETAVPPPKPAPSKPSGPVVKKTFLVWVNSVIPFGPMALRLPIFALLVTLGLLALLFGVITLLKQ